MAGAARYSLVYGAIAGAIVVSAIVATIVFDLPSHSHSELVGYLIMLAALSLIFVGVKRFRDVECGGVVSFGRSFAVGLGISTVAAIIYVIGWEAYLATSNSTSMADYMASYSAQILTELRASGASESVVSAKAAEMREMTEMYANPFFRAPMTFLEIFPVGLFVSLVSALILRNPRMLPKYAAK